MNPNSKMIKILIVEDDPKTRKTLSDILKAKGYSPMTADSGREALDRLKEAIPVVALIDLKLEDMSGLKVMKEIKERSPGTECIIITGYASKASAIEAVNTGAYAYIEKPYDMEQLLLMIRRAIEKREADEALRESEEKYKAIFNNVQVALFRTRISDGKLVEINEQYANMAGYSNVEDCMAEFNAADAWADPNARNELLRILKEKGSVNDYETEIIRRDGSAIWIVFSATIFPKQGFLEGSIVDINERKRAEEALRESEAQKQALLDGTPDMIIQIDTNMKVLWANSVALAVKSDIVGMTCHKGFINKDNPCEGCACKRAIETGNIESSIMYHPAAEGVQGESYWELIGVPLKNDAGEIAGAIEIARNITDRKQMENVLRENEAEKKAILNGITTNMRLVNENLETIWANKAAADSANKSPEEMVGHKCYEFWGDDPEKPCDGCPSVKSFRTKKTTQIVRHDQDGIIWDLKAEPVFDEKGNLAGVVEIANDITDKTRFETRLQQALKMEAIATLAGGVAHEFNNALMGIMGNIELLKLDFPENEKSDRYFEIMKKSGYCMSRLTDQLLAYAKGGKYQPKSLGLNDFVMETLPILKHDLSPEIRVETHFPKDISHIKADHAQMQMVLSAILSNSNEAIEDEGLIKITTENQDIDEDFTKRHPSLKPGPHVCLTIEDDGKGMDEKTRKGIFEPFFTTKFQGRGMGMAAAYGIVMNHDGWISVDSELGKGTAVHIYFPAISAESKEQGEKVKQPEIELNTGKETILMIEDEEVVIEVTQSMLEMLGYRVMAAETGEEAVHMAKTFDGQIDLALLDIKLPDMEGGKVYPLIMEARPDLKVIVFSGYAIDGPARKILDAGAQDFIQKPFSIATLSEKLKEVLEGE